VQGAEAWRSLQCWWGWSALYGLGACAVAKSTFQDPRGCTHFWICTVFLYSAVAA